MREDWETLFAVDHDRWAVETYRANFPGVDVRQAEVAAVIDDMPAADVIFGGPPCQGFSLAGEGKGEHDPRNGWPSFCRAVEVKQPRHFIGENVAGMLTERHIKYFGRVLKRLEEAGYAVEWKLLDAVSFGVPQFRKRVIVWGIRKDLYEQGMRHQWPKPTHTWPPPDDCMFGSNLLPGVTVGQALHIWYPGCGWEQDDEVNRVVVGGGRNHPDKDENGKWRRDERPITAEPCTTIAAHMSGCHVGAQNPRIHEYRWSDAMLAKHPPASPASPASTVQAKWFKGGAEGLVEVLENPAQTIASGNREPWPNEEYRRKFIRRLTPLECLRLQSGPDDFRWPAGITKTAMYRIIGNSIPSGLAHALSEAVKAVDPEARTLVDLFCGGGIGAVGWHGRVWRYEPEGVTA